MAKESAMVQIETKITCVCDSIRLKAKSEANALENWPKCIDFFAIQFDAFCWKQRALMAKESAMVQNPCNLGRAQVRQGMDHPQTLSSLNNLALVLEAQGHLAEAESLYREALEKQGFQRDFGQWIWSHTLLDFRWVIRFLMTGTGAAILAAILLGCFWMQNHLECLRFKHFQSRVA